MRLPVNDHRIDAPSDVIYGGIARHFDPTGLGINLALAYSASVGKYGIVHLVIGSYAEPILCLRGQGRARYFLRQFKEVECSIGISRPKLTCLEFDFAGGHFK